MEEEEIKAIAKIIIKLRSRTNCTKREENIFQGIVSDLADWIQWDNKLRRKRKLTKYVFDYWKFQEMLREWKTERNKKMKKTILLRADCSKEKGIGDVVTMMNIAECLKEDFEFIFASRNYKGSVSFIRRKGYDALCLPLVNSKEEEIKQIRDYCKRHNIKHGIIQIVPNDHDYVNKVSRFLKIMMIDFEGNIDVNSDILLNWSIS